MKIAYTAGAALAAALLGLAGCATHSTVTVEQAPFEPEAGAYHADAERSHGHSHHHGH